MRKNIAGTCGVRFFLFAALGIILAGNHADAAEDRPTIVKDSLQVTAYTLNVYRKSYDTWSWTPSVEFTVNGPIVSGDRLYAEFAVPGGPPVKFDCQTSETLKGRSWKTDCGGQNVPEAQASTYTGTIGFAIRLRNELTGTNSTLFTGKMRVAKAHSNEHGPKVVNHFVYYVDQDWNMPIGFVFLTAADADEWKKPKFNTAFWSRGATSLFEPHLFYQGKEVGKIRYGTDEVGKAGCSTEVETETSREVEDSLPQKARWARVACNFPNVVGWDKAEKKDKFPGQVGELHVLSANPGEYEIKLLRKNHLARSIKFTVGPDGKFDNGIATSNKFGSDRVIVPVQIIDDLDGAWNRAAWKNDAFYGNPVQGFTPVP